MVSLAAAFPGGSFFKLHASAFAAINPGFNSGNNDAIQGDFFDAYIKNLQANLVTEQFRVILGFQF